MDLVRASIKFSIEGMMMQERLICAAIYWDDGIEHVHCARNIKTGWAVCGWRHHNIIQVLKQMGKPRSDPYIEGFMTTKGRFVDREEAAQIAAEIGIKIKKGEKLTSEDLYCHDEQ